MQPTLYSFNTYTVNLTSATPASDATYSFNGIIKGVTKVYINYNQLNFTVKPYKIVLNWPNQNPITINNVWFNNVIDPSLTTFQPNSAYSYSVIAPTFNVPVTNNAQVKIYYENGVTSTFNISLLTIPDNTIDLDLNVLDVQNSDIPFGTIYNVQSNRDNVVYNFNDLINQY